MRSFGTCANRMNSCMILVVFHVIEGGILRGCCVRYRVRSTMMRWRNGEMDGEMERLIDGAMTKPQGIIATLAGTRSDCIGDETVVSGMVLQLQSTHSPRARAVVGCGDGQARCPKRARM